MVEPRSELGRTSTYHAPVDGVNWRTARCEPVARQDDHGPLIAHDPHLPTGSPGLAPLPVGHGRDPYPDDPPDGARPRGLTVVTPVVGRSAPGPHGSRVRGDSRRIVGGPGDPAGPPSGQGWDPTHRDQRTNSGTSGALVFALTLVSGVCYSRLAPSWNSERGEAWSTVRAFQGVEGGLRSSLRGRAVRARPPGAATVSAVRPGGGPPAED